MFGADGTEIKASEERSQKSIAEVRADVRQGFAAVRADAQASEERIQKSFAAVRADAQASEERVQKNFAAFREELRAFREELRDVHQTIGKMYKFFVRSVIALIVIMITLYVSSWNLAVQSNREKVTTSSVDSDRLLVDQPQIVRRTPT